MICSFYTTNDSTKPKYLHPSIAHRETITHVYRNKKCKKQWRELVFLKKPYLYFPNGDTSGSDLSSMILAITYYLNEKKVTHVYFQQEYGNPEIVSITDEDLSQRKTALWAFEMTLCLPRLGPGKFSFGSYYKCKHSLWLLEAKWRTS